MLLLLPILMCLSLSGVNFLFSRSRTRFRLNYLINTIGSVLILIAILILPVLFSQSTEPAIIEIGMLNGQAIAFQFDKLIISLAIGVGVVLLTTTFLMPLASRLSKDASIVFALAGFALIAVFAANPGTIILSWVLIDLTQFAVELIRQREELLLQNLSVNLVFRATGIFLLLLATVANSSSETSFILGSQLQYTFIIGAVLFRLRLIPPFITRDYANESLPKVSQYSYLLAGATSFIPLFNRTAITSNTEFENITFLLLIIGGVYAGLSWTFGNKKSQYSSLFWLMMISVLVIASYILKEEQALLAWSQVYLFGGCILLNYQYRNSKILIPLLIVLTFIFTGLPLTPTWAGFKIFSGTRPILQYLLLAPYFLLIFGTISLWKKTSSNSITIEFWQSIFYYVAQTIVVILFLVLGFYQVIFLDFSGPIWSGLIFSATILLSILISRRYKIVISTSILESIIKLISIGWLKQPIEFIYFQSRRIIFLISAVLEGETGLLWSLLTMLVLLSLLFTLGQ